MLGTETIHPLRAQTLLAAALFGVAGAAAAGMAHAADGAAAAGAVARPAVVELFTSEGCSSCPPAESYLGELSRRQDVIALTLHVDYWDGLGWPDRFALSAATARQRGYARALGLSSVYTPQMVIDGRADFVGSDRSAVGRSLASRRGGIAVTVGARGGELLVEVGAQPAAAAAEVLLVAYRRAAVSPIGRGENAGRTIEEFHIVREVRSLGHWTGLPVHFGARVDSLPADATDVAVLVQTEGQGPIIGAASAPLLRQSP
jgi:hypothetical protein